MCNAPHEHIPTLQDQENTFEIDIAYSKVAVSFSPQWKSTIEIFVFLVGYCLVFFLRNSIFWDTK